MRPRHGGDHRIGGRLGRKQARTRTFRKRFLIVCEGAVTETAYFECFPVSAEVKVEVRGEGRNTTSLVKRADRLVQEAAAEGAPYDEVWIVFDKDDFPPRNFNAATRMIHQRSSRGSSPRWGAAWSNPAFEFWYLLHFHYVDAHLHRHVVQQETLPDLLRKNMLANGYMKNDPRMYRLLLSRQETAIRNARRLLSAHPEFQEHPAEACPCTLVFALVEALNQEIP